jgi:hypothetical protein
MSEQVQQDTTAKKVEDIETSPRGVVKRWIAELAVADETEKAWRKESDSIYKLYEGENKKASSFNILWTNTETLLSATYNSTPKPDVRRRFRDADPLGKATSTVLERALTYEIDEYDFNDPVESVVLDTLLVGRGVPRIKYEPKFMESPQPEQIEGAEGNPQADANPGKLIGEQVECEHVQWDKFRRGPGKTWREVPWIAFEHDFTFDMAVESFGEEIANKLTYTQTNASEQVSEKDQDVKRIFKIAKVHEIWDKEQRRVLFISPSYADAPCKEVPDPLQLKNFWPIPRPAYAVKNSRSLLPTPLYRLYEEQAKELDKVSVRINKIVNALKVRGAYAAVLPEMRKIIGEAGDNDMVPIENHSLIADMGGLDKAIWLMPIDKLQQALQALYLAREQIKQTIYEINGIGDIMRGASDPNETLGAQQLKSQWGSMRLQRLQREVQRVVRDLIEIKAEVISQRFSQQTLQQITNVQLQTMQQKQMAQQQLQAMQQQAMQQQALGAQMQQPDPALIEAAQSPAWEEVMAVLRSDDLRAYKVDIETDSTIAESVNQDMAGLREVIGAIGELVVGAAPAVQSGMLPVESVKQLALTVSRHARFGKAVEDSLEDIQAPMGPPPEQAEQMKQMEADRADVEKQRGELDKQRGEFDLERRGSEVDQRAAQLDQREQAMTQMDEFRSAQEQASQQNVAQMQQTLQQVSEAIQKLAMNIEAQTQAVAQALQAVQPKEAA